jgi:hypothetical protein
MSQWYYIFTHQRRDIPTALPVAQEHRDVAGHQGGHGLGVNHLGMSPLLKNAVGMSLLFMSAVGVLDCNGHCVRE